jgi:hypothetical protein
MIKSYENFLSENTKETIYNFLINKRIESRKRRLEELKRINAPEILIRNEQKNLKALINGDIGIKDKENLLDLEFSSYEMNKGRGGKTWIQFETEEGLINYFPNAKYGPFITKN